MRILKFSLTALLACMHYCELSAASPIAPSLEPESEITKLWNSTLESLTLNPYPWKSAPHTAEVISYDTLLNTSAPDFLNRLSRSPGVTPYKSSVNLTQISTSGFGTAYLEGMSQIVDGIRFFPPGLGFPTAGLAGGVDFLDIDSIELVPTGQTALYGDMVSKGLLYVNTKNPFTHTGLTSFFSISNTSVDGSKRPKPNKYIGVRFAQPLSSSLAVKANFTKKLFTEIPQASTRDLEGNNPGTAAYNSIGSHGELPQTIDMMAVFGELVLPPLVQSGIVDLSTAQALTQLVSQRAFTGDMKNQRVSSTGYTTAELIDPNYNNTNYDVSLHYNFNANTTGRIFYNQAHGTTLLQATNLNLLDGFKLTTTGAQINNPRFSFSIFKNIEDSGNTHDLAALATRIANSQMGGIQGWFGMYLQEYMTTLLNPLLTNPLASIDHESAHRAARLKADQNMLKPGSLDFEQAKRNTTRTPISEGGAQIRDSSSSLTAKGEIRLSSTPVYIGGRWEEYHLKSDGTLFNKNFEESGLKYKTSGVFFRVEDARMTNHTRYFSTFSYDLHDHLPATSSYNVALVHNPISDLYLRVGKSHNYKYPTAQDLFIVLDVGQATLIGGAEDNIDTTGLGALYPIELVLASFASQEQGLPEPITPTPVFPAIIDRTEIGLRQKFKNHTIIDGHATYMRIKDSVTAKTYASFTSNEFLGKETIFPQPIIYSIDTNQKQNIDTFTTTLEAEHMLTPNIFIRAHYDYSQVINKEYPEENIANDTTSALNGGVGLYGFNKPKHSAHFSITHEQFAGIDKLSLNSSVRFSDKHLFESSFADAIMPAKFVTDMQLRYHVSNTMQIMFGAQNLLGSNYRHMPYGVSTGRTLYLSLFTKHM